jgi:hypothetical protein
LDGGLARHKAAICSGHHKHRITQNKRIETSMLRVVFEPTIPVFEREMTVIATMHSF